ncbi:hypothetical protein ACPD8N_12780 [Lacticaseibacillus chiayiensis]|uniref:ABC transporter permease n=2 Tax=Lacticaseibacillus chiayiensis TaxID=2100821 RepID=A0ABY6H9G1_9LACO|nr:hypothetical protein [Lacticaseibacillus chiayiensis]QVI35331.1 hypothetical protein KG086_03050 [Lacticaseibacillus chiayiensis]UYN57112.1 hypothetical protein OFW50_03135 [Lacticaseibacillus chiayiensis]
MIFWVLLFVEAVSTGMMLTVGTPARTEQVIVNSKGLTQITQSLNRELVATANKNGATLSPESTLVTIDDTRRLTKKMISASTANQTHVSLATINESVADRLKTAATDQRQNFDQKKVLTSLKTLLNREINQLLMSEGWGLVYPLLVLMTQTAVIVAAILMVIVLLIMLKTAHSWRRFLVVTGRSTYIMGYMGGFLAILPTASPFFGAISTRMPINTELARDLLLAYSPLWQRVAGWTIVIGLVIAALSHFLPRETVVDEDHEDQT